MSLGDPSSKERSQDDANPPYIFLRFCFKRQEIEIYFLTKQRRALNMTDILKQWLTEHCQLTAYQLAPLASDASLRRYFRIQQADRSYVAMDASLEKSSCIPYVAIANSLRKHGLCTPEIFAEDFASGFLLITDFGNRLYLNELTQANAHAHYSRALDALHRMQDCQVENVTLKPFTAEFMRNELELFKEWFFEKHLELALSDSTTKMLASCFDFLAESAAEQPYVFMHRDYHSANLMILPDQKVGLLDFQDAFIGPVTYDLVSLLRDCYVAWPEKEVLQLVKYFWRKKALPNVSAETFLRWFDLMGIQRHLKALLTFSRKYRRDHNANYLQHIPRTLHYILVISMRYPETWELYQFLKKNVVEKCVE